MNGTFMNTTSRVKLQDDQREFDEIETELTFNEYLQACYAAELAKKNIENNKSLAEQQLRYYSNLLHEKQVISKEVDKSVEFLEKQGEIIEKLRDLEENIENFKPLFLGKGKTVLTNLHCLLVEECNKLRLKNVKPLKTQEEVNKLGEVFEKLSRLIKDIMNVRTNEEFHEFALKANSYLEKEQKVINVIKEEDELQRNCVTTFIKQLSDYFAKKNEDGKNYANLFSQEETTTRRFNVQSIDD